MLLLHLINHGHTLFEDFRIIATCMVFHQRIFFTFINIQQLNNYYTTTTPLLQPYYYHCSDASVVHASGSGQLQANPHVAGPWLSLGKPIRRAITTMGSKDLVVGDDHMLGPSCQQYDWQTGRCGSIAFGSSPRRGKTLISNPRCLAEVTTCGKDFRR